MNQKNILIRTFKYLTKRNKNVVSVEYSVKNMNNICWKNAKQQLSVKILSTIKLDVVYLLLNIILSPADDTDDADFFISICVICGKIYIIIILPRMQE